MDSEDCIINRKDLLEYAIRTFGGDVYRFALSQVLRRHTAEDIYQEVFVALYQSAPLFHDDEHLKRWLFKTASHRCKRFFHEQSRRTKEILVDPTDYTEAAFLQNACDESHHDEESEIWNFVEKLSPNQRKLIYLFYVEQYTTKEIAEMTNMPHNTVRTNLRRARQTLRRYLEDGRGHEH
ncbi:sigma-70 family RNA polymerase sigma factor [Adlercreutzia sp. R25]|uniref:Sigma-70 family RNA polymerase sigma factor n=1 Tax=Adlercreutzia shanghongiae TaxID=3111773 RepID=A0ABU6J186_9ACTN|nr:MULTISPECIES: sigma-70 family RNA polymerase sigma factor [unclassified Adlercreutzia]MEC4271583.1 sigma-70 family RNA polymerase sigma factor [Adlercreutzia sp. R25]MEC4295778.1 sigma-70 family RNA polymerase sigma factor [Adlercreutzia sp. R22]